LGPLGVAFGAAGDCDRTEVLERKLDTGDAEGEDNE